MRFPIRVLIATVALLAALAVGAAGAYAAGVHGLWGFAGQTHVEGFDTPYSTSSTSFVGVPGTFTHQNGWKAGDRIVVRADAETACTGGPGWCSVRLVYRDGAGVTRELLPDVGTDFALASSTGSAAEYGARSVTRAYVLPSVAGGSGVWLEAAVRPTGTAPVTLRLDDLVMVTDVLCNARDCR